MTGSLEGPLPLGRVLGTLYGCGGTLALLWTLVPHRHDGGDRVVVAMALLAIALGVVLRARAGALPAWSLHAALAVIQLVIGTAYAAEADPASDVRLFFLWAAPYAASYFGARAAAAHLLWTATVLVVCLATMPEPVRGEGVPVAMMLLGTLTATAVLAARAAGGMRRAEAGQRHDATHDQLTGLANRRRLVDVLAARTNPHDAAPGALVLLDLDGFKSVNDRYGHGVGDDLLRAVGADLVGAVRETDLVCRLGGDEFAVAVAGPVDGAAALDIAARAVAAASAARTTTAPTAAVRCSAGVRLLAPGLAPSAALRDADTALYASKREGTARPHTWVPGMRAGGAVELDLADDLRESLRSGQLHLLHQPVVDIETMRVRGIEVLARWTHPVRGPVPPDQFVPCAERAGLAPDLTRWVLRTAFAHSAMWPSAPDGARINVAVNISALQLADLGIVDDVRDALASSGTSASDVVLEVTETAAVVDLAVARRTLEALADLGVGLALDDFGTGFSSLTHVQALPFDILKVDRSFVAAAAAGDKRAVATIAAVGALAVRLGVDVVAEGVEDLAQLPALRSLGCGYAQGYAIARPMEPGAIAAALADRPYEAWVIGQERQSVPVA